MSGVLFVVEWFSRGVLFARRSCYEDRHRPERGFLRRIMRHTVKTGR